MLRLGFSLKRSGFWTAVLEKNEMGFNVAFLLGSANKVEA